MERNRFGPLVGSIDEGTSSARFLIFAATTSEVLTYHQIPIKMITPKEGWVEQDPMEILNSVLVCIECAIDNLRKLEIDPVDIVTVGLTNQRETTIVWDSKTGKPLYNAIVWMDTRTSTTVDELLAKCNRRKDYLKPLCGLPISTYFSAVKFKWLVKNVPEVKKALTEKRLMVGTVDTWLIWNLTGGVNGGLYMTDCTNASRTMLMNLHKLTWDKHLCKFFDIPMNILPSIRSCSEIYGYLMTTCLRGLPISGCLGDQQSALVGQMCFHQGQAKSTYGTGCFLLYNTGTTVIQSQHGLLSTVGYKFGSNGATIYALEGSVAIAGVAIQWLRDNLKIIENVKDTEDIADSVSSVGEVYFVPAFSGLFAPYWRKDARSVICGITEETKTGHIVKATLEAVCFQIRDILEAMTLDCGFPLTKLLVDGGMIGNNLLAQIQADLCGIPVVRPLMAETTALGAAMAAGSAKGINIWNINNLPAISCDTFEPTITDDTRDIRYSCWKMAVERSLEWTVEDDVPEDGCRLEYVLASLPGSIFIISSAVLLMWVSYRLNT